MRKTRRHKYLQVSVFFLIYSIIHVVSFPDHVKEQNEDNGKSDTNTGHNPVPKSQQNDASSIQHNSANKSDKPKTNDTVHHHHVLNAIMGHVHGAIGDHKLVNDSSKTAENNTQHHIHVAETVGKHMYSSLEGKTTGKNKTEGGDHQISGPIGIRNAKNDTVHQEHVGEMTINHIHGALGGGFSNGTKKTDVENTTILECTQPAIKQFPHPIMSPETRRHGGLIVHVLVAIYMFLGLAIVCDEYFVASLDRICEELKMSPDVAGATFMAAGSSAPELATVIIGVFLAQDDIGISGVIGSAVFNIMFVISCCGLCSSVVIYLNWWPLIRDCFFYAVSVLVLLLAIFDESVTWVESLILLFTYVIYCVTLHYNTLLESIAYSLPVPFKRTAPTEQSGLVSYKTLDDDGKKPNYGMDWSPEKQQETEDPDLKNFGTDWSPERHQQGFTNQLSGPALNQATIEASPQQPAPPSRPIQQDYYKPKEYDPSTAINPLIRPEGGIYRQVVWVVLYPIHWLSRMTMPDCRTEKYRNWYPFTFFVSMVWISFYSYFMVWMITLIGYTLYIPDTVMGLTFVAAGVSVPDALSSIAVIKEGYGDMAVSNAVGSNVFDILVCLGLPWFIKTAIVSPGSTVKVKSKGLTYSTLSLLSTVVLLVVATHMNGWKLDRRYGIILMIWYLIFITFASIYEFNVFQPCDESDW